MNSITSVYIFRKYFVVWFVLTLLLVSNISYSEDSFQTNYNTTNLQLSELVRSNSILFTENLGQWQENIRFRADVAGATMWFTSDKAYFQFTRTVQVDSIACLAKSYNIIDDALELQADSAEILMINAEFVGANLMPKVVGVNKVDYQCNYFIGNDQSRWKTNVPNYSAIVYENIYSGIDLKYYGDDSQMEYDFIVEPGADYSQIEIKYDGVESLELNANGDLVITTIWGQFIERLPQIYQLEDNNRISINGNFVLQSNKSFSFDLPNYNPQLPIVIDPVLEYSTFLGHSGSDKAYGMAIDKSGNICIIGSTSSTNFPTIDPYTGEYQGGVWDIFVAKFNGSNNNLVYSTFIGGAGGDYGRNIEFDTIGAMYLTGMTYSINFPVNNAYQGVYQGGEYDGFVCKLNSVGDSLIYSTYLGSSGFDWAEDIAVDVSGSAYLTGRTYAPDFPTLNPVQDTHHDSSDVFITKLNNAGDGIIYSTYLGGSNQDYVYGIAVDTLGCAYVTGFTSSIDFPIFNAFNNTFQGGSDDVFVCKLNSSGDSLIYSTYLGGSDSEYGNDIFVNGSGSAYITGFTKSLDFPVVNSYLESNQGYADVFVTKLSSTGNELEYSTYFGGTGDEAGYGIAVDMFGSIYLTGMVSYSNFPTLEPIQSSFGGYTDAFICKLSDYGTSLEYSTYFGGENFDWGYDIVLNSFGAAYVTGLSNSYNFPTSNSYKSTYSDEYNAFLLKLSGSLTDVAESDFDFLPSDYHLSQNYPNPFNPTTTIEYSLPTKSNVTVAVYNLLGQKIQQLVNQNQAAGNYNITWDGTASDGKKVSTGVYFYRIEADNFVQTKKMLFLK